MLIDAGIETSDFETPEYQRIKRDARAEVAAINPAGRCGEVWRVFGPRGSFGRQLVRLRRPFDGPFVPK